jgi:hypothetical protein
MLRDYGFTLANVHTDSGNNLLSGEERLSWHKIAIVLTDPVGVGQLSMSAMA